MPFADELIGEHTAKMLVKTIAAVTPGRPLSTLRKAANRLGPLSLRERSDLLADGLRHDLPADYPSFAATIRAAADQGPFTGWLIWPVTTAVAASAVEAGTRRAFDDGMALLAELTPRLTSEFAVRTLLAHDLDRALAIGLTWTASGDEHVRRLASEGTRPFLPWAKRVPEILAQPRSTLPILDALYRDPSEYVRRSVANHLNDLSRQQPDIVVETATRWLAEPDANTDRLVRHALRTLVKKGHPGALALLGFHAATFDVDGPILSDQRIPFGGTLVFTATVTNTATVPAKFAIDYVVHHRKANGTTTGKTFKLTTVTLAPGQAHQVSKAHSFRAITTRRYYPGAHAIELQCNGIPSGRSDFTLLVDEDLIG